MKESVLSSKEKNNTLVFLLLNCQHVLKSFMTDPLNIIWTVSEYEYKAMGSGSIVYIFNKDIISYVLCGYEVQMNMSFFLL